MLQSSLQDRQEWRSLFDELSLSIQVPEPPPSALTPSYTTARSANGCRRYGGPHTRPLPDRAPLSASHRNSGYQAPEQCSDPCMHSLLAKQSVLPAHKWQCYQGVGGGRGGSKFLCVLRPLCVDLDLGPDNFFLVF